MTEPGGLQALWARVRGSITISHTVAMHLTLGVLGVATLLPWNIFITETQFFEVRSHNLPTWEKAADAIKSIIPLCFQVPNVAALLVAVRYQQRLSMDQQVLYPLIIGFAVILMAGLMATAEHMPGTVLMSLTFPGVVLLGLSSAFLQGGVFALAAQRGALFINSCITGQGLAGLAVALLSFVTQAAGPVDGSGKPPTPEQVSGPAAYYFLGSSMVVAGSVLGYLNIRRQLPAAAKSALEEPLLVEEGVHSNGTATGNGAAANGGGALSNGADADDAASAAALADASGGDDGSGEMPVSQLLSKLWGYCAVVVATFGVTLLVFPAITSSVCSRHNPAVTERGTTAFAGCAASSPEGRFYGDLFVPFSFVLFNLGDVLGRVAAGLGPWARTSPPLHFLGLYAAARLVLPVALVFCNVITPAGWVVPPLLGGNDAWPMLLVLLLGLTNGHLGLLALMHAPSTLPPAARKQSGPVLSFCVVSGLISGSMLSLVLVEALHAGKAAAGAGAALLLAAFAMPR